MRRYLILLLGCVFWGLAIVPGVYSSWQDQLYIRGEIRLNDVSPLRSVEQGSDSNLARKVDEHKGTVAGTGEVPDHKAEEGRGCGRTGDGISSSACSSVRGQYPKQELKKAFQ
ncbi:MAG: hypothetical protein ACOX2X_02250 [Peptococcia bacterium]